MRAIAGALVVLAGAILLGAGVLANALVRSAGKSDDAWGLAAVGGVILGIVGLAVLVLSVSSDRKAQP
jgi:hypothetical protein